MVKRNCFDCGKEFETRQSYINRGHGKFCTQSCSNSFNTRKRNSLILTKCAKCGKKLKRKPYSIENSKNHFCNRECKAKYEYVGVNEIKREGSQRRAALRRKQELIDKHGIKCQLPNCSQDLFGDRRMIDIHHFDGPLNHDKTVLLCPYHHRLADFGYIKINEDGKIYEDRAYVV